MTRVTSGRNSRVAQTGNLDLSDAGFLRDPLDHPFGGDALKPLAELDSFPALALLGEPGIGKSTTLKLEHERLSGLAAERNRLALYVDLKISSSEERLYRQIFETPTIETWKADRSISTCFSTVSTRPCRVSRPSSISWERDFEAYQPTVSRSASRVARRSGPPRHLGGNLRAIWGEAGLGIFELAPLRRRDVLTALSAHGIQPEEFIPKLFGAHAVAFAIKPLTLKMLLSLYQRDGRLPTSTRPISIARAASRYARSKMKVGAGRAGEAI